MKARLTAGVALAAALVAMTGASAADRPAPVEPALHGRQVLMSTSAAARAVVTIGRDVPLPGQSNCVLSDRATFAGSAAQAAVVLTSLPQRPDSRVVWIAKLTFGREVRAYDSECLSPSIPKGRYLLQLIHSPGTSSVTLSLPGLTGTGSLHVKGPDRSTVEGLPQVVNTVANAATASWGSRRNLASQGSILTIGAVKSGLTDAGADAQGDCLLTPDTATLPDAAAYAPGCPAGGGGTIYGFTGRETWTSTISGNLQPGSYGAGFWFSGTPTHTPLGGTSFWITNLS